MKRTLFFLAFITACGDLPDPALPNDQSSPLDDQDPVDLPDDDFPPEKPYVTGIPSQYGYTSLPIHGTADPYVTIFVEGGAAPVATDADASGNFCVDVELKENQGQTLEIYAQNNQGVTSEPRLVEVRHNSALEQTIEPEAQIQELAENLPVQSDKVPDAGDLEALTDDDANTTVTVRKSTFWVDLGDVYDLSKIEIRFPDTAVTGDDTFATEYMVLASKYVDPIMPPEDDGYDWEVVMDVYEGAPIPSDVGDGGVDTINIDGPLEARFVAVYLIENNKVDWFSHEEIIVSDFKVYGVTTDPTDPVPATPTCANGAPLQ